MNEIETQEWNKLPEQTSPQQDYVTRQEYTAHRHNGGDSSRLRPEVLPNIRPVYNGIMAAGTNAISIYRSDVTANSIIDVYADLSLAIGNWTVISFAGGFTVISSATPEIYNVPFSYFINN
jgi:hypothetical protein